MGYVACGASVAGVIYPTMLRYLIDTLGFNNAVRCVAGLTTLTCIYSFIFCTPDPAHDHHEPKSWTEVRTWFDTDAFKNKAWWWFTAAVAFMFFGFYPVFFNLEEVRTVYSAHMTRLTPFSGPQFADLAQEILLAPLPTATPTVTRATDLWRPSGCLPL